MFLLVVLTIIILFTTANKTKKFTNTRQSVRYNLQTPGAMYGNILRYRGLKKARTTTHSKQNKPPISSYFELHIAQK